ncbi:type IV pilus modification protein PilV [Halomonas sp. 3H]|uniref:type IV pilus modification protein PilV n=1 Tax=Halomonas sp. 3H TaxID=2952527 RepID=UPI0020B6D511|nr:type IV pilus modification protein PilV [Halomonas sp. 3H]
MVRSEISKNMFAYPKSRGHGFTLLEALIALLVLAVGLIAIAGMQLKALQAAQVSYFHTLASIAAQDAVERLRVLSKISDEDGSVTCYSVNEILASGGIFATSWTDAWGGSLPGLSVSDSSTDPCVYTLLVEWEEARLLTEGAGALLYHAKVPDVGYIDDEEA